MKPSDFRDFPCGSVMQKCEAEQVAVNIMVILARTGDVFRPLSWDEYVLEREKDGHFTDSEKGYFEDVIGYCKSVDTAILFSKCWKED